MSKNYRIVAKFLLAYIAVIAIVISFFIPIYFQSYKAVKKNSIHDSYNTLKDGFQILDNQIVKMQDLGTAMRNEQNFIDLIHLNDDQLATKDYYVMSSAQKYMRTIMLPSDAILNSYFLFRNNSLIISNDKIFVDSSDFYGDYFRVKGMTYDQWISLVKSEGGGNHFLQSTDVVMETSTAGSDAGGDLQSIPYIVSLPENNTYLTCDSKIVYMLDSRWILRLLCTDDLLNDGFISITDKSGQVILSRNTDSKKLSGYTDSGVYETKVGKTDTAVMTIMQSDSGLRVIAGIPLKTFQKRIGNMTNLMIFYFFLSILFGLIAALFLAYRNSRPLQSLLNTVVSVFRTPDKKENEYKFIGDALLEINAAKQRYQQEVEQLGDSVKTSLFDKLLTTGVYSREEIDECRKELSFLDQPFFIAVLRFRQDSAGAGGLPSDLIKIMAADIVRKYIPGEIFIHNVVLNRIIVLVPAPESASVEEYADLFSQIVAEAFKATGRRLVAGLSSRSNGYRAVHGCYTQAADAIRMLDDEKKSVILYTDRGSVPEVACGIDDVQKLYELLLTGDEQSFFKILQSIYRSLIRQGPVTEEMIRHIYYNVQNVILYASREQLHDKPIAFEPYSEEKSIRELFEQLNENADRLFHAVDSRKKSRNTKLKDSIITYLEAHYSDGNLCAASVSGVFHITDKYLFNFIKEQTGKSFGDYLENLRLEQAIRLLRDTEFSIREIGDAVGFNSQNAFYKVFKRVYGVSPGSWRKISNGKE